MNPKISLICTSSSYLNFHFTVAPAALQRAPLNLSTSNGPFKSTLFLMGSSAFGHQVQVKFITKIYFDKTNLVDADN